MRITLILLSLLVVISASGQKNYKHMMADPQVNFYDVVKEAEAYFTIHAKDKGSGWKGYQRWRADNESKYYPDGDRSMVDPFFTEKAYLNIMEAQNTKSLFSGSWRDLGPYDANNITSHYSPGIGRVECFWVNPNDSNHIYMGSRSGGFWRTSDEGAGWENTTDYLTASGVNTIAVSPGNSDSVLINVQNAGNNTSHGIFRSTDGGATWNLTAFNPVNLGWGGLGTSNKIFKIVYHPSIPNLVFVGTSKGIFKSTDNLSTWSVLLSSADITDIEFHPFNPNIIYLYDNYYWSSSQNVVFRSVNLGVSYTESNQIAGNSDAKGHIAVTPQCPDCVFFASSNGVWKSTDAGINFTLLSNPDESCQGFAVSDTDSSSMLYGYVDLELSTNGGAGFTQVTAWANSNPDSSYVHADLRTAESVNGVYYVGTDGYLAKSTDNGFSWTRLNDGTGIREFYAVGLSQSNWMVQMAGSQDNGTSILDELGWIEWNGGDGMEAIVQPLNDDWMMGSWQYGTRQRTKDGGQSRQGVSTPQSGSSQADWQAPLLFNPNHQMKVYHFSDSIFVSNKFGGNWNYVGSPDIGKIKVAAIAENNSALMIVCRNDDILLSADTGATYTSISTGLTGNSITDIAFDPKHDSTIVAVYNRYQNDNEKIFISHNLGGTWTNISYNLGNMPIRSILIDHTQDRNIYVGAEIGVYTMPMNGNNWIDYSAGLAKTTVRDLEIQYGSNVLRAATWGRGLWEYTLVGRNDYPAILTTQITNPPTDLTPLENFSQYVTSVISYDGSLSSVFVKWSVNGNGMTNTLSMQNTQDSTWVTQSPIPNYPAGSDIYFKVFAVGNSGDTSETYRFMYSVKHFDYCESYGNMDYTTAVTLVDFNGIYNQSGKTQPYTDYSDSLSTVVESGNSYLLNVNLDTDGNYVIHAKAWIDWNRDGEFDVSSEEYDLGTAQNTANGPTNLSPLTIVVPSFALAGETLMRVSAKYNNDPEPCATGFDGEVEDYTLFVECETVLANIVAESCGTYTSPSGNYTFTTSGNYADTIVNTQGCDSLLNIDLTITELDTSIIDFNGYLMAGALSGSYQWIDCDNNNALIPGATAQSFTPAVSGNYAVIVSENSCVDTSYCYFVLLVNIEENTGFEDLMIYPNPTSSEFNISLGAIYQELELIVSDLTGKEIYRNNYRETSGIEMDQPLSAGAYLVNIQSGEKKAVVRLMVQ